MEEEIKKIFGISNRRSMDVSKKFGKWIGVVVVVLLLVLSMLGSR